MKTICVVGVGYIGLPTACMFAKSGYEVFGVDVKRDVVDGLNEGKCHIKEPGLPELLASVVDSGHISFGLEPIVADAFIICVPTPLNQEKRANLDFVKSASESIVPFLTEGCVVILESTVPPRTCDDVIKPILEQSGLIAGAGFSLAFCPERVIPGRILVEITENDRIIGGIDEQSTGMAKELYGSFVQGNIYETNSTTAEMVKLMENTYRDVNIALANEFTLVAETIGINIWNAIKLANKHPRVNIHQPGPGVGGHCIPVVPWFIVEKDTEHTPLIQCAREVNDGMPRKIINILEKIADFKQNPVISVWGVAFKADTDDCSYSPATDIIKLIVQKGGVVKVHDPYVENYDYPILSIDESLVESECILIVADHEMYKTIDPGTFMNVMKVQSVLDTRNIINNDAWSEAGFNVFKLGDKSTYF
ncbi:MAG TPA: nucleotide sugar dehydrogenase [Candidatus Lokiarchaeia archaeon]|nr:nucleotide sugar dehydrogenase [Candidatus Lokiarchaeia archaeon]